MVTSCELYTSVIDKLRFEPGIDESNITVSIKDNGIVVLGGNVQSYAEKYTAENAVERLKKEVMLKQLKQLLVLWSGVLLYLMNRLKLLLKMGTLDGEVSYNFLKERARKSVQDLNGVTCVTNHIRVLLLVHLR